MYTSLDFRKECMESGAVGFLLKDAPASELAVALRRVMAGDRVVDRELALAALSEGNNLPANREREVLSDALFGPVWQKLQHACFSWRKRCAIIFL